jgi:UrcA family protein
MKESKIMRGLFATVALIALSAPAVASATPEGGLKGKAVKVSYGDLNLERQAGAKVLYRRLQQASREVCGVESLKNAGSLSLLSDMKSCYQTSLTVAVEKIASAELTRIHEG